MAWSNNSWRSSPKIFTAISDFTPAISSLNRIWMGCVNSKLTSGYTSNASSILASNSSIVSAFFHSDGSFNWMIKSQELIPIGSVGISEAPIRDTTCLISVGNFFSSIAWAAVLTLILWDKDAFVGKIVSTAKSPSFSSGINSPPKVIKRAMLALNRPKAPIITHLRCFNAQWIMGW